MKKQFEKLANELYLSITYGEYKILEIQNAGDWNRMKIEIDEVVLLISVSETSVLFYDFQEVEKFLTKDQIKSIHLQLFNEIIFE